MSKSKHHYAVIVAGGTGARLWPVSRTHKAKQFQPLLGKTSLFKGTYALLAKCLPKANIFVQVNQSQIALVKEQVPNFPDENFIVEPISRDTGPAYLFAAATLELRDPKAKVAIFWSDHIIHNHTNFKKALQTVYATLNDFPDRIVSLGVTPTYPHTGLGYIKVGKHVHEYPTGNVLAVEQFVEKPDAVKAETYLASQSYLWNTGYSSFSVSRFGEILAQADPTLAEHYAEMKRLIALKKPTRLKAFFSSLPRISIDYWLMEKLTRARFVTKPDEDGENFGARGAISRGGVADATATNESRLVAQKVRQTHRESYESSSFMLAVPADLDWSDVSDWKTVHDLLSIKEAKSVVSRGAHVSVNCTNCLVVSSDRLITTVGLTDIVLIDTGDAILAIHKNNAQEMKQLIALLKASNHKKLL